MKGKFQYIMFGAVITLLAISAALVISLQRTSAQVNFPALEQQTEPTSLPAPTASATAVIETANKAEALDPVLSVESSLSDAAPPPLSKAPPKIRRQTLMRSQIMPQNSPQYTKNQSWATRAGYTYSMRNMNQ